VNFLRKIFSPVRRDVFFDSYILDTPLPDGRLVRDVADEIKSRTDLSKSERHKRINTLIEAVRLLERQRQAAIGCDLDCSEESWGWTTR